MSNIKQTLDIAAPFLILCLAIVIFDVVETWLSKRGHSLGVTK